MGVETVWVSKILKGDVDAFANLVGQYQSQLYNFIYKMSYSKEDTEEILQDVFIKVYNNLYKYDESYSFSTWIYRIALNTFKTLYKKKKRNMACMPLDDFAKDIISDIGCPDITFEKKENYTEIIKLINNLKEEQKIIFILKYIKDFTYKEIAEIVGITPEAARMKAHRAKLNLWEKFRKLKKRRKVI